MIRLMGNTGLARALHDPLHDRLTRFATLYTPEMEPEGPVDQWLHRLYMCDDRLHILVTLSEWRIVEHVLIDVQYVGQLINNYPVRVILWCNQVWFDKPNLASLDEVYEYGLKLKAQYIQLGCKVTMVFYVEKNPRTLMKRYGFKVARTVLFQRDDDGVEDTTEEQDDG